MNTDKQQLLQAALGRKPDATARQGNGLAQVAGLGCSLGLLVALMMPFASGPMGMSFSGWRVLGGGGALWLGVSLGAALVYSLANKPLLVGLAGTSVVLGLMAAGARVDAVAQQILASSGTEQLGQAMSLVLAGQVGMSWGAGLAWMMAIGLLINPLLSRRR